MDDLLREALFKQLLSALDRDIREAIVRRALETRGEIDREKRRKLELVINDFVKVNGFRNPLAAPQAILLKEVVKETTHRPVLDTMLEAWSESLPKTAVAVEDFLADHRATLKILEGILDEKDRQWAIEGVIGPTVECLAQNTGCTTIEVRLMLYALLIRGAGIEGQIDAQEKTACSKDGESSLCEPDNSFWNQILSELTIIPAGAKEWNGLDQFVADAQELAGQKALERSAIPTFEKSVVLLQQECEKDLHFFGMHGTKLWTAERVSPGDAMKLAEQVGELRKNLLGYGELRLMPAVSIAEMHQQQDELSGMEQIAWEIYKSIDEMLEPVLPTESEIPSENTRQMDGEIDGPTLSEADDFSDAINKSMTDEEITLIDKKLEGMFHPEQEPKITEIAEITSISNEGSTVDNRPSGQHSLDSSNGDRWENFFWELLSSDDLAGAYWLSRSLNACGQIFPVQRWLVQAVQGARWLNIDSSTFVGDLSEITRDYQLGDTQVEELLGLAASLRPTVIAPPSGMLGWLKTPSCCPAIDSLVQAVKDFAHLGKPLRRIDLLGAAGVQQYEQDIRSTATNARQWLEEAQRRRTKMGRATNVWLDLVKRDGELRTFLQLVADDQREQWNDVRTKAIQWLNRDFVEQRIVELDHKLIRLKIPPITGDPREQIIRYTREVCELALSWCDMVERDIEGRTQGRDWLTERISALRTKVLATRSEVQSVISELQNGGSNPIAAAASCLARSLEQLYSDLELTKGSKLVPSPNTWNWLTDGVEDMGAALARRLLVLPELNLEDSGEPSVEAEEQIADILQDTWNKQRDPKNIIEKWLSKKDYRFIRMLLTTVQEEDEKEELARCCEEEISGSRSALKDMLRRTSDNIEQAVVDGILSNEERSTHLSDMQNIDPDTTLNFHVQYERLDKISGSIAEARQTRLRELRGEWDHIKQRLATYPGDDQKKAEVLTTVMNILDGEDTRVMEECIAQLAELMDAGEFLNENPFDLPPERNTMQRNIIKRFIDVSMPISDLLNRQGLQSLHEAIKNGNSWGNQNFANLSRGLKDEALASIKAWRSLKQGSAGSQGNHAQIEMILRYLGFNVDPSKKAAMAVQKKGEHWLHLRAAISAGGRSPVPQFGSQQQGMYDIVCLWERPSVDTLTGWLRDLRLESRSILVIYLGRMSRPHRKVMRLAAGDRGLAIIVFDEVLFAYLADKPVERLPVFFRCVLPFSTINPYTPFNAGDVPPEMFFGRKAMAHELQRIEGNCIVYGGRQLGKSALLRHVQREFHNPEREQYARVEDIKLVGSPMSDQQPGAIWNKLRDIFKEFGLLSSRIATERPDEIARLIEDALEKKPHCRVLILFDEADNFLDADSVNEFKVVDGIRILMANTQRHFKVVLAGLHNVQRFQGRGNQPLAHFGTPLCVGPLEPDAAQRLILEPLSALGFSADNSVVLTILSYTNYHPGLIQLFCQELLNRINTRSAGDPPYTISREDVEAIYRDADVRTRIRERFDWTLALDHRYQAIAWTMILDQAGTRDGFSQAYTSGDLLVQARQWWPKGFEDIETDQLRGLLEEMCGLGVLVRDSQGHYRLRSPNMVRLMEDVESCLLDLAYKEPDVRGFDPESYHAPLGIPGRYSPLTYAQENDLNRQRYGVNLVFALSALGLSNLDEAFQRFVPAASSPECKADLCAIPIGVTKGSDLIAWLNKYLSNHDKHEHLVLYRQLQNNDSYEADLVQAALRFVHQHRKRQHQSLRVLFVFGPRSAWRWLSIPEKDRLSMENQVDTATSLRRWSQRSILQRLAQQDKIHSEDVCQEILRVTGGWPCLLDALFERCGLRDDPRLYALDMERELADPGTPLFGSFLESLGLEASESIRGILDLILREEGIPQDIVESEQLTELMYEETGLSIEECEIGILYAKQMGLTEIENGALRVEPTVGRALKKL
jgi:ribosome recycling factor